MTGEVGAPVSTPPLGQQPGSGRPGARCECGCGRHASRRSGYRWYHGHDPAVPLEEKRAALQLGGRRGAMSPAEASQLFESLEPTNAESRTAFRLRLMELLSVGRLTGSMYRDLLAGLDGMTKDQVKGQAPPAAPLVVEVQRFTTLNGPESTP
jgi:hypothetical protein